MSTLFIGLLGEIRKTLLISWNYKANMFVSLFTLGFIFVGIVFFLGGGMFSPDKIASALLGYLVWMYTVTATSDLSYGLRGEISAGTLEQLAMSPAPVELLLVGRVIATLITATVQVILMGIAMYLLLGIHLPLRLEALPALLITLVGVFGFGFIIAGAVLIFKQIESFNNFMNNALAFFNGSFLPVSAMPIWMAGIAKTLPSTLGIIVIREIILEGKSLATTWRDGSLVELTINSVIYFAVGWLVFAVCERIAKNRGSLGQY
ncbi:MAG: ABC transporter permease [Anaerolineaceae bacterium]|nr:ABC transporter permease [Anaerolineaceae bacterium]